MKRIKYLIASLLCLIFLGSIAFSITLNKRVYADGVDLTKNYWELTPEELENVTNSRTTPSNDQPQITVFTHGWGSKPSNWSNDQIGNKNKDYSFSYEAGSMIDALYSKTQLLGKNVSLFHATVEEFKTDNNTNNSANESRNLSEEESIILSSSSNAYGASQLKGLYANFNFKASVKEEENTRTEISDIDNTLGEIELHRLSKTDYSFTRRFNKYNETEVDNVYEEILTSADINNHIILIFEAKNASLSNDYVYAQLEYILDVISYRYLQLSNYLPTYNLIGHSRGGITNLQYALAHPYNVASLYSMGTPYNGSDFGGATGLDDKRVFLELIGFDSNELGVKDILNTNLSQSYKNFWNTNYSLYSHIDFNPIGTYVDLGFILGCAYDAIMYKANRDLTFPEKAVFNYLIKLVDQHFTAKRNALPERVTNYVINLTISFIKNLINKYLDTTSINAWLSILGNFSSTRVPYPHIGFSYFETGFILEDDLFIDLDSQIADGYTCPDVKRKVKLMNVDSFKFGRKAVFSPGIAHNLETHDIDIILYVVTKLTADSGQQFIINNTEENSGTISGITKSNSTSLTIPSSYNGISITKIQKVAFYEAAIVDLEEEEIPVESVTSITIPASVTEIDDWAFSRLINLQTIIFEEGSQLERIGKGAFFGCTSLQTITNLPSTLTKIGDFAFSGCSSLTAFNIPASVDSLGSCAFFGCSSLQNVTVDSGNLYYSSNGGILFDKNQTTLVLYPEGKTSVSYAPPATLQTVGDYALVNNTNIRDFDLRNVKNIGSFAFINSTNLNFTGGSSVENANICAFEGTAWYTNNCNNVYLSIGKALLKYSGTSSYVDLRNYVYIDDYAFCQINSEGEFTTNNTLEHVIIGNEEMIKLNLSAFYNCEKLSNFYIVNNFVVEIDNSAHDIPDVVFNVPSELYSDYEEGYADYSFEELSTVLRYIVDGLVVYEENACYGEEKEITYVPDDLTGYTFGGWYEDSEFSSDAIESIVIDSFPEKILYAQFIPRTYTIILNKQGGTGSVASIIATYQEPLPHAEPPVKTGYTFKGYYTQTNGRGVKYYDADMQSVKDWDISDSVTLYACWNANRYNIICKNLMEYMTPSVKKYTYGEGLSTMPKLYRSDSTGADMTVEEIDMVYGWYEDISFTKQITSISSTAIGDVTIYAKYDYWLCEKDLEGSYTIDSRVESSPVIELGVYMGLYYDQAKTTTLNKIKIRLTFYYWEEDDGNQQLYVYEGSNVVDQITIDRTESVDDDGYNEDRTFLLDIDDYQDTNRLYLKFGVTGWWGNTWHIENIHVEAWLVN